MGRAKNEYSTVNTVNACKAAAGKSREVKRRESKEKEGENDRRLNKDELVTCADITLLRLE